MERRIHHSGFVGLGLLLLAGCTPNANTYYNRQMQPIVTKYNVLFNGEEAFDKGYTELQQKYHDDFSDVLPVEPIGMSGKVQLDGMENPNFERAEEKAIKTIQRHSMVYKGEQRNYKIDDAYMLLGKARYYNERFFPALEAFNHLLTNYGKSEHIPAAAVWAQKTNLRLGRDKVAIEKLNTFLEETPKIRRNDKAEAYATLGQAYINQEQYPQAADALYTAGKYTRNRALRGRYYFIAAQLYEKQKQRDSAVVAYEKVIKQNWKIPRRLWIEAQAGMARNKVFTPEEKAEYLAYLTKLENRYEHKDFLDVLYYQHAELLKDKDKASAIAFYRNSLSKNKDNNPLKAKAHERLADIYFEKKDYTSAYHHLDSTLTYIPEHTFEHLYIRRKKDNLAKITELEYAVKHNDSILKVVRLPKDAQVAYYQKHIDSMQQVASAKVVKDTRKNTGMGISPQAAEPAKGGKFYFYNPMAVAYGKQQFQQYWGDRKLEDNWRWSATEATVPDLNAQAATEVVQPKEQLTPEQYIAKLPTSQDEIRQLEEERNQALYQLGVLYRAKFSDHELAIQRLKRVLEQHPSPEVEVATLYELYKNYQESNDPQAEAIKTRLLASYGNTDYAKLLQGAATTRQEQNQQAQQFLDTLMVAYEKGDFVTTATRLEAEGLQYRETAVAPKIALLQAKTTGRLQGVTPYREQLDRIVTAYPATPESEEAKDLLEELKEVETEPFMPVEKTTKWKVVITRVDPAQRTEIAKKLTDKLKSISEAMTLSEDVYNKEETWLVVHHLRDAHTAETVIRDLKELLAKYHLSAFAIATENYRLVQMRKDKDKYLETQKPVTNASE